MSLANINVGDTIQFIAKVDRSLKGQEVQNVILKVTEITATYVKGVNAMRALDLDQEKKPFRTYKLANIVPETVWKLVA